MKTFRKVFSFFLCLSLMTGIFPWSAQGASAWPDGPSISAEGGILIDGDSGAILYGKNIHEQYFPASITKILTALIIIENCQMDEIVTFSHNAVYNVEVNSSNANMEEGDRMTVRDCLYAMMLRSANEAANALAEHAANSTEAFSAIMNAKAASLGCTDSHFSNPSGLNDPDHYTSAHDMALIAKAAFENETFSQIVSTLYYDLPPTKRNKEGLRIYPGHQMIKKNSPNYYAGVIGGKTGYTSLAGNTLVTCAKRNDLKLITVVLNGHQTHYTDTRAMLNFGFRNFHSVDIAAVDDTYTSVDNDMTIAGLPITDLSVIYVQENRRITLPSHAEFSDTTSSISYELPPEAPEHAAAYISYEYNGHAIGSTYLLVNRLTLAPVPSKDVLSVQTEAFLSELPPEAEPAIQDFSADISAGQEKNEIFEDMNADNSRVSSENPQALNEIAPASSEIAGNDSRNIPPTAIPGSSAMPSEETSSKGIPFFMRVILGTILVCMGAFITIYLLKMRRKKISEERMLRFQRRQQRLLDIGMSNDEFNLLLKQKRMRRKK
ncbi:MAG: D-alanyl-D-alanine carboxypeptidase [Lachnospiraceae bacterium]|jgi:D-alanyl-D-alanine carboxypeptidase (penicillin-binding protein 5/6)|nr:D-alanyl-D-alanine carboxypeptidase [Lachnospiraceae bacterium]